MSKHTVEKCGVKARVQAGVAVGALDDRAAGARGLLPECALEESNGDASMVAKAIGDIARAKGMSQVAKDSGLSRESLYKALSGERSPGIDTILKVINALGIKLHAEART